MGQRRPFGALGFGDAESRSFQKASAWASLAAMTASRDDALLERGAEQPLELGGRCRAPDRPSSLRPARASGCSPASGERVPGMCLSTSSQRILAAPARSLRWRWCALRGSAAGRARAAGLSTPAQATARAAIAGTSSQRDGGDHAERAFGADQQLVEAVAAIVLLEAGEAVVDRCRREAPLRRPRPARASSRTSAPACRRRWSRSGRRWCSCRARRASAESACRPRARRRGAFRAPRRLPRPRRRFSALIERMRFIRRIDSSSAEPSAGGVAPRGHAGVAALRNQRHAMLGGEPDDVGDFLGRGRREDGGRRAVDPSAPVGQPRLDLAPDR